MSKLLYFEKLDIATGFVMKNAQKMPKFLSNVIPIKAYTPYNLFVGMKSQLQPITTRFYNIVIDRDLHKY